MNQYVVFIRLPTKQELGEGADAERSRRLNALLALLFSCGPAYHACRDAVLLHSDLTHTELVERIRPLIEYSDFACIVEMSVKATTAIGYDWEPDDLDALYPNIVRLDVPYTND